jgi:hypothetical protein
VANAVNGSPSDETAAAYMATTLLKAAVPGLFPSEVIGSLVLRDGAGVTRA